MITTGSKLRALVIDSMKPCKKINLTYLKKHGRKITKIALKNVRIEITLIPSLTTELALLKICLVSKRYELQNVKPNEDMLRGKKGRQNVGERDTTVRVCKISFPTFFSLFFFFILGVLTFSYINYLNTINHIV